MVVNINRRNPQTGEVRSIKIYDIRVDTEMMNDPYMLLWKLMGKTDPDKDEWIDLSWFSEYNEESFFETLKGIRKCLEYSRRSGNMKEYTIEKKPNKEFLK